MVSNRIYALMVSIPQRESALSKIVDSLYNQVDEFRIVLNDYTRIPAWMTSKDKIKLLLNTPDKYTSNAIWMLMNKVNGYVFTCDDDIIYPKDYVSVMIKTLQKYNNKAVVSMYGEWLKNPPKNYVEGREGLGFCNFCPEDKEVDIVGTGCAAFHTQCIHPKLEDFPDTFSRDIWFSIYIHRQGVPIIRVKSGSMWLRHLDIPGSPEIRNIWRKNVKLKARREEVFMNILVPLRKKNG